MPRVVPDQRSKFENDEMFRKLSRESEVRMRIHFLRFKSFCTGFYALVSLTCIFFIFADQIYDVQGQTASRTCTAFSERLQRRSYKCRKCLLIGKNVLIGK